MGERTTGLYRLITFPRAYDWVQELLGATSARMEIEKSLLSNLTGCRVLEIGCGPGHWSRSFSKSEHYLGIDRNESHVRSARRDYSSPSVGFECGDLSGINIKEAAGNRDLVFGVGILHHLDDEIAREVMTQVAAILPSGGRYLGVEPVKHDGQNIFAQLMKVLDSGRNIRYEQGYRDIFGPEFSIVRAVIRTDLLRVPYSHILIDALRR